MGALLGQLQHEMDLLGRIESERESTLRLHDDGLVLQNGSVGSGGGQTTGGSTTRSTSAVSSSQTVSTGQQPIITATGHDYENDGSTPDGDNGDAPSVMDRINNEIIPYLKNIPPAYYAAGGGLLITLMLIRQ